MLEDNIIDFLGEEIEKVGMLEAFEVLTSLVEEKYQNELKTHVEVWSRVESQIDEEKALATATIEFLNKLKSFRQLENQATELVSCLYHPSREVNFSKVFQRANLKGRITKSPKNQVGHSAVVLMITSHFFENEKALELSAAGLNNIIHFFGNQVIITDFWRQLGLGLPFLSISEVDEKRLHWISYNKLVHALIIYEGWDAAKKFVINSLKVDAYTSRLREQIHIGDPKTLLLEYFQSTGGKPPNYVALRIPETSEHQPEFSCTLAYKRFGTVVAKADSKRNASKKAAEKLLILMLKNPSAQNKLARLASAKVSDATRRSDIQPKKVLPSSLHQISDDIEKFFGIQPQKFWLFQALTTKRQGHYPKLPNNDGLSMLGASIIQFSLQQEAGADVGHSGLIPHFCNSVSHRIPLYEHSSKLLLNIAPKTTRLEETFVKATIASLFLSDQSAFFDHFPIFLKKWLDETPETQEKDDNWTDLTSFNEHFSYITYLQELVQKVGVDLPAYSTHKVGEDHAPVLHAQCKYKNYTTTAASKNSKSARNGAAYKMLLVLTAQTNSEKIVDD